jgi:hypothetical protein
LCGCSPASSRFMPVGMSGGTDQPRGREGNDRCCAVRLPRQVSPTSAADYSRPSQPRKQNTTPSPSVGTIPRRSPSSTPCSQSARTTSRHYPSPRPSGVHGAVVSHRFLSGPSPSRLDLTNETADGLVLDLSPCKNLIEIRGEFAQAGFEKIIPILETVTSPRFRKLTFITTLSIPEEKRQTWEDLDGEITALAKRVNATAVSDTLEVLFSCCSTGVEPDAVMRFLPGVTSDVRVSLRVENLARS